MPQSTNLMTLNSGDTKNRAELKNLSKIAKIVDNC